MSCFIINSKTKTCADTSKIGGLKGRLWLYNLVAADGAQVVYTQTGNTISDIAFGGTDKLFEVDGEKFAHNFTYAGAVPGINKYYTQGGTIKTIVSSDDDIEWLDQVFKASSLGAIYEDLNGDFIVLGALNGLKATEGDMFDSGTEDSAEVGTTITFAGQENKPFLKFFESDYSTTLAKLNELAA
jgi:hypothetical protein